MKKTMIAAVCLAILVAVGALFPATALAAGDEVQITLSDDGITVDGAPILSSTDAAVTSAVPIVYYEAGHDATYGEGAADDEHGAAEAAAHSAVTITQPGVYRVSGTLSAGQIAVDLGSEAKNDPTAVVELILDNAHITCTVGPAIIFYRVWESEQSDEAGAVITLADGSTNTANGSYVARIYEPGTTDKLHKYDGAVYSKRSMIVRGETAGTGKLTVNAENEGIDSEMHLTIDGGVYDITAQNDGMNANEDGVSVITIEDGDLYIDAGLGAEGDGIDSNGYLRINGGTVVAMANPRTGDGGIDADLAITINGGTVIAFGSRNDSTSTASTQQFMELTYAATQTAGAEVSITEADGIAIMSYSPAKAYQSFTYSSPALTTGATYCVYSDDVRQQHGGAGTGGMDGVPGAVPGGMGGGMGGAPAGGSTASVAVSADFTLAASTHSFWNVTDYTQASSKTAVTFRVNSDNTIANTTEGSAVVISYAGAFLADGSVAGVPESDIQFTITDVPSEDYAATCALADGAAALANIVPNDPGTYQLTIAVADANATYTGSSRWTFTIREADAEDDGGDSDGADGDAGGDSGTETWPFTDVKATDWCYTAVEYVYSNGLMKGVSATSFAPTRTLTRAMLVTIVYRLDGEPVVTSANPFSDVAAGSYYTDAVIWASANGIVTGYTATTFGPDDPVTRQQLATILWRYAKLKGYDVSVGEETNILSYDDAFFISEYAIPAIQWACGAGVMQGSGSNLNPAGHATRAQAAAMLQRFAENVVQ